MIKIGKKCFNELCRPKKVQNKAWKVGDSSFLLSKTRKNFQEKLQEAVMHTKKQNVVLAINFHFPKFGLSWTSLRVTKPPKRNHFLKKIK